MRSVVRIDRSRNRIVSPSIAAAAIYLAKVVSFPPLASFLFGFQHVGMRSSGTNWGESDLGRSTGAPFLSFLCVVSPLFLSVCALWFAIGVRLFRFDFSSMMVHFDPRPTSSPPKSRWFSFSRFSLSSIPHAHTDAPSQAAIVQHQICDNES